MTRELLLKIMADYLVVPIALAGGAILLWVPKKDRQQVWGRAVVAGLTALLLAKIASLLYQGGQRPFEMLGVTPGAAFLPNPGFPSDHTLLVFTVTWIVWATTKNIWWSSILLAASIAVALGRIIALVHTPLDVAGGIICAAVAVILVYGRQFFTRIR